MACSKFSLRETSMDSIKKSRYGLALLESGRRSGGKRREREKKGMHKHARDAAYTQHQQLPAREVWLGVGERNLLERRVVRCWRRSFFFSAERSVF